MRSAIVYAGWSTLLLFSAACAGTETQSSSNGGGGPGPGTGAAGGQGGSTQSSSSVGTGAGGPCTADADCPDDGVYCNGVPKCVAGTCQNTAVACGPAPAGCKATACDETVKACVPEPYDEDGDGHGKIGCPGGTIPDDDCDDKDADKYPTNWDGPLGDGHPDKCNDGVDQDCSGTADDGQLQGGATCTCSPGDTRNCGTDVGPCEFGTQTCNAAGQWDACVGGVGPAPEACDGWDNDCNGVVDDGDPGGGAACFTGQSGPCASGTTVCTNGSTVCIPNVAPSPELCDGVDNDCNGAVDDGLGLGSLCDGPDGDNCAEGVLACNGSGGVTCSDNTGTTSDNCDPGNDGNCNGVYNEGCGCVNGQTMGCGDPACGTGIQQCSGGVWGGCAGDPQPSTQFQFNDGGGDNYGDFGVFACTNCSGGPAGSIQATHWYSGPIPGSGSVGGSVHMEYVSGGCYTDNAEAVHVDCYSALPGCAEPPETWANAYIGTVSIAGSQTGAPFNVPGTSASGRTVCCDVTKSTYNWTPCLQSCCHRKVVFDWSANGCF